MTVIIIMCIIAVWLVWCAFRPPVSLAFYATGTAVSFMLGVAGLMHGARATTFLFIIVAAVAVPFVHAQVTWYWTRKDKLWLALTCWAALSLLWSSSLEYGLTKLFNWALVPCVLYFAPRIFIRDLPDLRRFLIGLAFVAGSVTVVCVVLAALGLLRYEAGRMRAGSPLTVARVAWICVIASIHLALIRGAGWRRFFALPLSLASAWLFLSTGSRGSFVSGVAVLAVMILFLPGRWRV